VMLIMIEEKLDRV